MNTVLLAALVVTLTAPPHPAAPPPAMTSGATRSDALLSCEEDTEALTGTPFGRECPATSAATAEPHAGSDDDGAVSFGADDAEAEWDLAFGDERDAAWDERSASAEE